MQSDFMIEQIPKHAIPDDALDCVSQSAILIDSILPSRLYWWFDRLYLRVESASWIANQIDHKERVAYVQGSKIPFAWLREVASTAFQDGIDFHRREIFLHEVAILKLESQRESYELTRTL